MVGVNEWGDVFIRNEIDGNFIKLEGKLKHVSIDYDGFICGVNDMN